MIVGPGNEAVVGDHGEAEDGVTDDLCCGDPQRHEVGVCLRHRIDSQQRPEEHESRGHQRQVRQFPDQVAMEGRRVPRREIDTERRDDEHQGADRGKGQDAGSAAADQRLDPRPEARQRGDGQRQRPAEGEEERHQQEQQDGLHRADVEQDAGVDADEGHRGDHGEPEPQPAEGDDPPGRPAIAGPDPPYPGQVEPAEQQHERERPRIEGPVGECAQRRQPRRPVVDGGEHMDHARHAIPLSCGVSHLTRQL